MGQAIAKRGKTGVPPAIASAHVSKLVERFHREVETSSIFSRGKIGDRVAPSPAQRQILADRAAQLREALKPGAPSKVAAEALRLFDAWPAVRMDEAKAAETGLAYGRQIEWAPLWAVAKAVEICQGRDTPFPPSAGQLRAEVIRQILPYQIELRRIEAVLNAEIYHVLTQVERDESMRRLQPTLRALRCPGG